MVYTIDNEFMEQITTYDGTTALRRDCRFIKGEFYIKNKQCFYIDDRWYRVNSNLVVFDHERQSWVLKDSVKLINGIVSIKEDVPQIGWFSANLENNIKLWYQKKLTPVINIEVFRENVLIKEGINSYYYFTNDPSVPKDFYLKIKPKKDGFYTFPFNYGSEELIPEFSKVFSNQFVGEPLLSNAFKYIEDFTFGVEFETERGAIPERFLKKNGLIACKDGSIAGFEYTTVPLHGEKGIQAIKTICELLKKYCSCSPYESLHIHLGGYPRKVKELASLYKLGLVLQNEIYSIFPYFYVDTSTFKRKSYCGPLPVLANNTLNAKDIFANLYYWLSNGGKFTKFPDGPHPMDRSGQHKWEISVRYVYMNLIPIVWGGRGTVEFRCHTPTVSAQKVINWLFITTAILKYARENANHIVSTSQSNLSKLSLSDVIYGAYPDHISQILIDYIEQRKSHYSGKRDEVGEIEIRSEEADKEIFTLKSFV